MEKVIGIDLGTTNSCVSVIVNDVCKVIPNKGGYKTTPSMVAMSENNKRLIGQLAKRQAIINAENTIYATKRLIGRRFSSPIVQSFAKMAPYQIIEGPHDDVRIFLRGQEYTLPEISAMVLSELKSVAEEYLQTEIHQSVITVPAYFNDNQRQATKDAGEIAGLEVLRIINEPTAAALAYGYNKEIEKKIAIFDLGGGTFDISILDIGKDIYEVIATVGDTFLGGEDFDNRLMDYCLAEIQREYQVDLSLDKMALQRLKQAVEECKCKLSLAQAADINLPFLISTSDQPAFHFHKMIKRDHFENLCQDLVERTVELCVKTLDDAGLAKEDIDDIILVGGMTRMPKVQELVADFFGKSPQKSVNPDEVVSIGAAIHGESLLGGRKHVLLLDVTPQDLGIMVSQGYFKKIINKNTTIPINRSELFTTIKDNQTAVHILVFQGNQDKAEENEFLGEFILGGLRKAKKGEVDIEVTFNMDSNGILKVSAIDLETTKQKSITIKASSGLTRDEISHMRIDNESYLLEESKKEKISILKDEKNRLISNINALLDRVKKKSDLDDYQKQIISLSDRLMGELPDQIDDSNLVECLKKIEEIKKVQELLKVMK